MSRRRYLTTLPWPESMGLDEPRHTEPSISSLLDILRAHGSRLSRIEEKIEDILTNGTSYRLLDDDPPCEIASANQTNANVVENGLAMADFALAARASSLGFELALANSKLPSFLGDEDELG